MKRYAMVLLGNVIDVVTSDNPPNYPPDPQGNPVTAIECDSNVELGMVYDEETKTFSEYVPPAYVPTQLDRIEESLKTSLSEAQQTAIDKYTEELLEGGIL